MLPSFSTSKIVLDIFKNRCTIKTVLTRTRSKTMKRINKDKVREVVVTHHHRLIWIAVVLVALSSILFALELLAIAGTLGVLGVLLQGLLEDN